MDRFTALIVTTLTCCQPQRVLTSLHFQVHGLDRSGVHRHLHIRVGGQTVIQRVCAEWLHIFTRCLELVRLFCDRKVVALSLISYSSIID